MNKKVIIVFLLTIFSATAQVSDSKKGCDTIIIHFRKNVYEDEINAEIEKLYSNQYVYFKKHTDDANKSIAISTNFNLDELSFQTIPVFRIIKDANKKFNCESDFQKFISFDEYNIYQKALIYDKQDLISVVDLPNYELELTRINNPSIDYYYDKDEFELYLKNYFLISKDAYSTKMIRDILATNNNNFFFGIFGIYDVIFEIDSIDNELYANWIGVGSNRPKRMLADDYVFDYLGIDTIKQLSLNQDLKNQNYDNRKKCKKKSKLRKKYVYQIINL